MKKILVLSDSHRNFEKILKIYEKEKPDVVVYAGDGIKDIEELSYVYTNEYHIVKGNCDFFEKAYQNTKIVEIEKKKILITHGHMYRVKSGLENIRELSKKLKIDIFIYGHTHIENLERFENSYIFNPGASKDGKYGIIFIKDKKDIKFFHKKI